MRAPGSCEKVASDLGLGSDFLPGTTGFLHHHLQLASHNLNTQVKIKILT